jgi:hypothetical protein
MTMFLYTSFQISDIETNKFVGVFSCMFVYIDAFV